MCGSMSSLSPPVLLALGAGGVGDAAEAGPRGMKRPSARASFSARGTARRVSYPRRTFYRRARRRTWMGASHTSRSRPTRAGPPTLRTASAASSRALVDSSRSAASQDPPLGANAARARSGGPSPRRSSTPIKRRSRTTRGDRGVRHRGRPRAEATADAGAGRRETPRGVR